MYDEGSKCYLVCMNVNWEAVDPEHPDNDDFNIEINDDAAAAAATGGGDFAIICSIRNYNVKMITLG